MSGGFGAGFLKGFLLAGAAAGAVSLALPVPPLDPAQKSQTDLTTPSGSGFNAGKTDIDPVLPDTDQSVVKESLGKPEVGQSTGEAEIAGTDPARPPAAHSSDAMPKVEAGDDDVALVSPSQDQAPNVPQPALGVPIPTIDNPLEPVNTPPLPQIEQPETTTDDAPVVALGTTDAGAVPTPQVQTGITDQDGSALKRNRAVFENPEGKPLFAVILIDAGDEGLSRDILSTFSFPVTFAERSDANGAANAAYLRDAGFEILSLAPGADTLTAHGADISAAIEAVFASLPQSIGLVDDVTAKLQQDSQATDNLLVALKSSGHSLVSYDLGLNAADQKAIKAGVKSATIFRVIDRDREKGETIKRYLDRAVLEAGKDGFVVVLGHSYPETVTALFSWALSAKSATVAMAPVSAVMLAR